MRRTEKNIPGTTCGEFDVLVSAGPETDRLNTQECGILEDRLTGEGGTALTADPRYRC